MDLEKWMPATENYVPGDNLMSELEGSKRGMRVRSTERTVPPMEIRLNDNGAGRRRSDVSNRSDEFIFSSQPKRAYLM